MLCAILTVLEDQGRIRNTCEQIDFKEAGISEKMIIDFWASHKKKDQERRRVEAIETLARARRAAEDEATRQNALNKLTPKERELLGLR